MFDRHAAFRSELAQVVQFDRKVRAHRDQMTPADADSRTSADEQILQHVAVAFEDIPEDMHESVRVILMHPTQDRTLRDQVVDVAMNVAGGGWGEIEDVSRRLAGLQVLSSLSTHSPYTYRVDDKVIRGARPTPDKLLQLRAAGCRATVNLCREMPAGDDDLIAAAGLAGQMQTAHISITDNTPPAVDQVAELLAYLAGQAGPVYVHCEAGVGRTGVMVACYRMFQGWPVADALLEARHFGCTMPDQLAFIENRASAPRAQAPAGQPTPDALGETAVMNSDPTGLTRVLAAMTAPLGPAAAGPAADTR